MDQVAQNDPEGHEERAGSAESPSPIRQRDPAAGSWHEERAETPHQGAEEQEECSSSDTGTIPASSVQLRTTSCSSASGLRFIRIQSCARILNLPSNSLILLCCKYPVWFKYTHIHITINFLSMVATSTPLGTSGGGRRNTHTHKNGTPYCKNGVE